jgi:hypothetical protein
MAPSIDLPDVGPEIKPSDMELPPPTLELDLPPLSQDEGPQEAPQFQARPQSQSQAPRARAAVKAPQKNRKNKGVLSSIKLEIVSIALLVVFMALMYFLGLTIDEIPSMTLVTYVESIWLLLGCFFVVGMLQDYKTALALIGVDGLMIVSVFPTLWLLFDMRINPMYFFVLTLIMLLAFVYIPIRLIRNRKPAAKATTSH